MEDASEVRRRFPTELHYRIAKEYSKELSKKARLFYNADNTIDRLAGIEKSILTNTLMEDIVRRLLQIKDDEPEINHVIDKYAQMQQSVKTLTEATLDFYVRISKYVIRNAESTDYEELTKHMKREDFMRGVIRLAYDTAEEAQAAYMKMSEAAIKLADDLHEIVGNIPGTMQKQSIIDIYTMMKEVQERDLQEIQACFDNVPEMYDDL